MGGLNKTSDTQDSSLWVEPYSVKRPSILFQNPVKIHSKPVQNPFWIHWVDIENPFLWPIQNPLSEFWTDFQVASERVLNFQTHSKPAERVLNGFSNGFWMDHKMVSQYQPNGFKMDFARVLNGFWPGFEIKLKVVWLSRVRGSVARILKYIISDVCFLGLTCNKKCSVFFFFFDRRKKVGANSQTRGGRLKSGC